VRRVVINLARMAARRLRRRARALLRLGVAPPPGELSADLVDLYRALRGRRRRRRRAGTALIAVALAGAGTVGIWQAQRATDRPTTVAPPPAVARLNAYLGWWQDNIDATLFLHDGISAEQRAALGRRLESEPEVTRIWFESRQQAFARWVASGSPGKHGKVTAADLPESFRLRARDQATVARVRDALCRNPTGEHDTCAGGVLLVVDEAWLEAVP
jgi:hypothetical protein